MNTNHYLHYYGIPYLPQKQVRMCALHPNTPHNEQMVRDQSGYSVLPEVLVREEHQIFKNHSLWLVMTAMQQYNFNNTLDNSTLT